MTTAKTPTTTSIPRIGGNATTQACAACKYQRRKCAPDCILAPFFPHDRQQQFLNAHKLFGVSNITKIIKNLDPPEKDIAMRTIIFQSDMRAKDPVGGCYRIIRDLQHQIFYCKAELDLVLHQLAICRAQVHQQNHLQMQEQTSETLGCDIVNADPLGSYTTAMPPYDYLQPQQEQERLVVNNQHVEEDVNAWGMQDPTMLSSVHVKHNFGSNECDDVKPLLDIPNQRHEIKFEPEELVESSFVPSTELLISS